MKKIDICGVKINSVNIDSACKMIEEWILNKQKVYVCIAPASTIVDCQSDAEYREVINNANMVTPDGMPLVWLGKFRGNKEIKRTYGPGLMLALCAKSEEKGYRHYFYGGTDDTCQLLEKRLKEKFPSLNVAGKFSPPYVPEATEEDIKVIEQINMADPDILWVGLGSPKQDFWMNKNRDKLNVPVIIGVGAAFDFLSGIKKQAPVWMQRCGLEWFFRLCCEPKRLWKRYLVGNIKFMYFVAKDSICKLCNPKRLQ